MDLNSFLEKIQSNEITVPKIKEGNKVKGVVIKKTEKGFLISCENDTFTGLILPKEAKNLERNGTDLSDGVELEAEIINLDTIDEEGYYIVSISKLIQYDIWKGILSKIRTDQTMTVIPSEANLGGLLVDMHGIKGFIPLSQLAPVNYPRVEDGDQEKIFEQLLLLMGKEFKVRVINVDEENKRLIFSEREALREEKDQIMENLGVGEVYEGTISGVSSYGLFVTIGGGIEGLVHVSEITYGHVDNIERFGKIGDNVGVKVIGYEDGKISLSIKKLKEDPWNLIPKKFSIGDVVEGEVIRYVPYGVFIRVYDDINGLIHLSEITSKQISNPAEILKLGQKVKAKIILMDPSKRKMGLSMKVLEEGAKNNSTKENKQDEANSQKVEKKIVYKKNKE